MEQYRLFADIPHNYDIFYAPDTKRIFSDKIISLLRDFMYDLTIAATHESEDWTEKYIIEKDIELFNKDIDEDIEKERRYNPLMVLTKDKLCDITGHNYDGSKITGYYIDPAKLNLGMLDLTGIIILWEHNFNIIDAKRQYDSTFGSKNNPFNVSLALFSTIRDMRNAWEGHTGTEPDQDLINQARNKLTKILNCAQGFPTFIRTVKTIQDKIDGDKKYGITCIANTPEEKKKIKIICDRFCKNIKREIRNINLRLDGIDIGKITYDTFPTSYLYKYFIITDESALMDRYNRLLLQWNLPFKKIHLFRSSVDRMADIASKEELYEDSQKAKDVLKNLDKINSYGNGYFGILKDIDGINESDSCIINYIQKNPDEDICVITQKEELYLKLNENMSGHVTVVYMCSGDKLSKYPKCTETEKNKTDNTSRVFEEDPVLSGLLGQEDYTADENIRSFKYIPTTNDTVCISMGEKNNRVTLLDEIGSGGEGKVYRISNFGNLAVKIYSKGMTEKNIQKIKQMVCDYYKLRIPKNICRPINMITDAYGEDYIGFSMNIAEGYSVEEIVNSILAGSDTFSFINSRTVLCEICIAIAELFARLHKASDQILMGDINPANIFISDKDERIQAYFIDVDSFQYQKYKCPVSTPDYTSPRIYMIAQKNNCDPADIYRTIEDELFAESVLFFYILMTGEHPFENRGIPLPECILNGRFKYRYEKSTASRRNFSWQNLGEEVSNLFSDVFENKRRVSEDEWIDAFNIMKNNIRDGYLSNDIFPSCVLENKEDRFKKIRCRLCGKNITVSEMQYKKNIIHEETDVCQSCKYARAVARSRIYRVKCPLCGKRFSINMYDAALKDINNIKCPDCDPDFLMSKKSEFPKGSDISNADFKTNLLKILDYAIINYRKDISE